MKLGQFGNDVQSQHTCVDQEVDIVIFRVKASQEKPAKKEKEHMNNAGSKQLPHLVKDDYLDLHTTHINQ